MTLEAVPIAGAWFLARRLLYGGELEVVMRRMRCRSLTTLDGVDLVADNRDVHGCPSDTAMTRLIGVPWSQEHQEFESTRP